MAIETTRGLPSFSEMYSAFKNRGGIGDAIAAGTKGLVDARNDKSKRELESAQATESLAKAKAAGLPKSQNVLLTSLTPAEQERLKDQAAPDERAQLVVPWQSVVALRGGESAALKQENEVTKQGFEAEKLRIASENAQRLAEKDAQIAQLLNDKLALSKEAQAGSADASVLGATPKAGPGMLDRTLGVAGSLASKVSPTLGEAITPSSIEQARMRQEALKRQQTRGGGTEVATPAEAGVTPSTASMIAKPESKPEQLRTKPPTRIYTTTNSGKTRETARRVTSQAAEDAAPRGLWIVDDRNVPFQKQ